MGSGTGFNGTRMTRIWLIIADFKINPEAFGSSKLEIPCVRRSWKPPEEFPASGIEPPLTAGSCWSNRLIHFQRRAG